MTSKSFTRQWLEACGGCCRCSLSTQRQQVVVSRGNPNAQVMLIGEAPGASEDAQGLPFVGRSGQLLDQLLVQAGLSPDRDLFITNVVKCRPPDNRKPSAKELSACRPWIEEQIAIVDPTVVILVGATAVSAMLGLKQAMRSLRGVWIEQDQRSWLPIFHPSYLLRNPSRDPGKPVSLTLEDLCQVRDRLCQGEPASGAPKP
ncbi:uracil-DNA glycosylase [Synechococcus sp. RS9916]|uniref:uracil-DNA glycosylase n=1 Tax=Synechococcus sp. RS9916 TaxID=221359 RepID=UPI0000E54060|nr:uracil-DNA glycosylase [Synechococcus sp. RS9916]EAU73902.1 phage SPO1 DNA polymerase-related protein [Synechococcus sp. RS9916]